VDWSTAPNVIMGAAVMIFSLFQMHWHFDPLRLGAFFVMFSCGLLISYCFMIMLTSLSVWMIRNQGLLEMWWLFSSLARYPKEIFTGAMAEQVGRFFTYVVPILLVVNVPANTMVMLLDWPTIGFTLVATIALLAFSRWFFHKALRSYRSASS